MKKLSLAQAGELARKLERLGYDDEKFEVPVTSDPFMSYCFFLQQIDELQMEVAKLKTGLIDTYAEAALTGLLASGITVIEYDSKTKAYAWADQAFTMAEAMLARRVK